MNNYQLVKCTHGDGHFTKDAIYPALEVTEGQYAIFGFNCPTQIMPLADPRGRGPVFKLIKGEFIAEHHLMQMKFDLAKLRNICSSPEPKLEIDRIIFADEATIVFFNDGTKVVSQRERNEYEQSWDAEKGVMACLSKKLIGSYTAIERAMQTKSEWF